MSLKSLLICIIFICFAGFCQAQTIPKEIGLNYKSTKKHWSQPRKSNNSNFHRKQFTFGMLGGSMAGLAAIGYIETQYNQTEQKNRENETLAIILSGYGIGSALGVYIFSSREGYNGKFKYTLLGSAIGAVAGGAMIAGSEGFARLLTVPLALYTITAGSVLGYNLSKGYSYWGAANIDQDGLHLGLPVLCVTSERTWLNQSYARIDMQLLSIRL